MAFLFSALLCFIATYKPNIFKLLIADTKRLLTWLITNTNKPGEKISRYFLLLMCPTILTLSILFFQISPQIVTLSNIVQIQKLNNVIYFIATTLMHLNSTLFTVDGAIFTGILFTYLLITYFISFAFILFPSISNPRKLLSGWLDGLSHGIALFSVGIPFVYILSAVLDNFSNILKQQIFGINLSNIVNWLFLYLLFRLLAIVSYRIADHLSLTIRKLSIYFFVGVMVASIATQIFIGLLVSFLSPEVQPAISSIPIMPIGYLSALFMLIHSVFSKTSLSEGQSNQNPRFKHESLSHDRKITFRIRSMLAKQVEHD
jgi:hypothetical protein